MKRLLLILMCLGVITLTACTDGADQSSQEEKDNDILQSAESSVNPFEEDVGSNIIGSMTHGFAVDEFDDNGEKLPIIYNGGELSIEYTVKASGTGKNVGFLLFIDGIPQYYRTNTEDEYSYMTSMSLKEDDVTENLTFMFTPTTGEKGETLMFYVVSIYNPDFMPDMVNSSSYGMYHNELTGHQKILFNEDAQNGVSSEEFLLSDISVSSEFITDDFIAKLESTSMFDLTDEQLNTRVMNTVFYNNQDVLSGNIAYGNDPITVECMLYGVPTASYKTTFFLNHQAISESYDTTLEKGKLSVITVQIDPSLLSGMDTFYAVSVPTNELDFNEENVTVRKSNSILLYKGE